MTASSPTRKSRARRIAISVALLPFVARRFGEGDITAIRSGVRQVSLLALGYCALVVAPALILAAPWLARMLAESPLTAELTRGALWLSPLACATLIPFQLYRPVFEGLQRGRPGLIIAVLRYLILTAPCGLLGMWGAGSLRYPALFGLLVGLIAASAATSGLFAAWYLKTLGGLESMAFAGGGTGVRPSSAPGRSPAP